MQVFPWLDYEKMDLAAILKSTTTIFREKFLTIFSGLLDHPLSNAEKVFINMFQSFLTTVVDPDLFYMLS